MGYNNRRESGAKPAPNAVWSRLSLLNSLVVRRGAPSKRRMTFAAIVAGRGASGNNSKSLKIVKTSFYSLLIKMVNTLLIFLGGILLARVLGPKNYGIYAYVMSIIVVLSIPITAGLPNLFVREVAKAKAKKDWQMMRYIFKWSSKLILFYSILLGVIGLITWSYINKSNLYACHIFLTGLFFIPILSILLIGCASLRGLGCVILGQIPSTLISPALFLLFIATATYFYTLTPEVAMQLKIISTIIPAGLSIMFLWYLLHRKKIYKLNQKITYSLFKSLGALTLIGGFQLILNNTDVLILGLLRTDEEVGIYRVTVQMASLVVFGLYSINQILHPQFAKLHSIGDKKKLQQLVSTSSKIILAIAIPPVLILTVAGEPLLKFVFGDAYASGALPLAILALGQLANASFGSVGALLNMSGHENDTLKGMLVAVIVNIILNFILIPRFGSIGAALGTAISCFAWNVVLRNFVQKRLGIESSGWIIKTP